MSKQRKVEAVSYEVDGSVEQCADARTFFELALADKGLMCSGDPKEEIQHHLFDDAITLTIRAHTTTRKEIHAKAG